MTPDQLLRECEEMTFAARMHSMVELGQRSADDPTITHSIATLSQGTVYQRILAVQSCFGSRDADLPLQGLTDPSRSVRALSLVLVALIASDSAIQQVFEQLPFKMQRSLLRRLHNRHRYTPIDAIIETLVTEKDDALPKLLLFASPDVVERHLPQIVERFDLQNWHSLARLHPSLAVAQLRAHINPSNTSDRQPVAQANAILPLLARETPDLALELVNILLTVRPLAAIQVQPLVQYYPNEIVDLVVQSQQHSSLLFDHVAHKLTTDHLLTLYTRYPDTISPHRLRKLTTEQRATIYTECRLGWRNDDGLLAYDIVASLPTDQRIREAHRHLHLPALQTRPTERLRYATFLPWDEARTQFDSSLRSPDADLRGATLHTLISVVRYQRDHLTDALTLIRNRRNEQDPVRRQMLAALSLLPPGIWHPQHLDELVHIIQDTLNASDLSSATAHSLEFAIVRLLPFHLDWCANQLSLLYQARGSVSIQHLDRYLSDEDTRHIAPIFHPIIQSWLSREAEGQLISMAHAFAKRLPAFDELVAVLETLLHQTRHEYYASNILQIFSQYHHERLATIIPHLLEQDKSTFTLPTVYTYLHEYRQDLLNSYLGQHTYQGRFSTGKTRFVPGLDSGFFRWTPLQQTIFAQTLLEVANEADRPTVSLLHALHQLAAMPAIDPNFIIQFANDERQPVRDSTLYILATLDAGQGIPPLLDALNDARARIAIYALRTPLLSMPPARASAILHTVPLTQVTVAKEVVRLIGELPSEIAFDELLAIDKRDLHRDVRVALLRALWSHTHRPETWDIFTRAAQSPDPAIARGVVRIPVYGLSPFARHQLTSLMAALLNHPLVEVRMDALQRCAQQPINDYDRLLLSRLLPLMNSELPEESQRASQAVFTTYIGRDAELAASAVRTLLANRRALSSTIATFTSMLSRDRLRLLPTTRALLDVLQSDPLTLSLRLNLVLLGLPWDEAINTLLLLIPSLHPDALVKAQSNIAQAANRPDSDLLALETRLAASNDERARRLALATLITQSKQTDGWTDERIERLHHYQQDPSPLVAETAQYTFPS